MIAGQVGQVWCTLLGGLGLTVLTLAALLVRSGRERLAELLLADAEERLEVVRGERDRARDLAAALEAELACDPDPCPMDLDALTARLHLVEGEGR
jgi:hypothetical protein